MKGDVKIETYPWLGILYYFYDDSYGENRAVTTVALIHKEFVIGAASDIAAMPKHNFRDNTRVLLGEGWHAPGRRVRNYIIHPEYKETYNTLALVQLKDYLRDSSIRPLCPATDLLRNPEFFVVKFKDADYDDPQKEVIPMTHVPGTMCKDFYVAANLYAQRFRPPNVVCAVSLETEDVCVWDAGGVLVTRDVWGRWQLLGVLTRGPGCGAPSRYLDMLSYYPWVHASLDKFQRLTISRINQHFYALRSSQIFFQRFGACDEEEKRRLVYRDAVVMRTDNLRKSQYVQYNMSVYEDLEMTCLTLEMVNASATSEMRITHLCPAAPTDPKTSYAEPCHVYKGSSFHISVTLTFSEKCLFEMRLYGDKKNLTLIDIMDWKWEEATYYHDFTMTRVEYSYLVDAQAVYFYFSLRNRGQSSNNLFQPTFFFIKDLWTTTEFDNSSWSSTTPMPMREVTWSESNWHNARPTRGTPGSKRTFRTKTTPTTPTTTTPRMDRTTWNPAKKTKLRTDFWRSLANFMWNTANTTSKVFEWARKFLDDYYFTKEKAEKQWSWFVSPPAITAPDTTEGKWWNWAWGG